MKQFAKLAAVLLMVSAGPALADFELSAYGGYQTLPHSTVKGNDPGGLGKFDFTAGWEGKSFEAPPYWGVRGTWWQSDVMGFALDFSHTKAYADDETKSDNGFDTLEFTDGLNLLTVNVLRRFPMATHKWTPYVGGGAGITIPHVEVTTTGGRTFEYQYGGPALQWVAGVTYPLSENWKVFGEYKGNYSWVNVDLDNGGNLETNLVTNALNVGVSFDF